MRPPPSRIDRALRPTLWVLAALLIPLALVVGLGRELLPLVSQHKAQIEAELATRAGLYVRLGELDGGWRGLRPVVTARQVTLYHPDDPTRSLLTLPSLQLKMDWWATLRDISPRLAITLEGLSVTVFLDDTGRLQVRELMSLGRSDPAAAEQRLRWLLSQPELALVNSTVNWEAGPGHVQQIRDIRLQQARGRQDYRLRLDFRQQGSEAEQQLLLQVAGDPLAWQRLPWRAYLRLNDLTSWHAWTAWLPAGWSVDDLSGQASVWLSGTPGQRWPAFWLQAESVDATLDLPMIGQRRLTDVTGRFHLQVTQPRQGAASGWSLALDDVAGAVDGEAVPVNRFQLQVTDAAWELAAGRIRLGPVLQQLGDYVTLPEPLQQQLDALQPAAVLTRVRASGQRSDTAWSWRLAQAEFKGLQLATTERSPGVRNLAGWFSATPTHGLAYLDSRGLVADLQQVFREPTPLNRLTGGLRWLRQPAGWHVDSGLLRIANADAEGVAQFSLRWPDQGAPALELLARLQRASVANAYRYVPWPSAGDKTLAWLRRALKAGEVRRGDFLYSGTLGPGPRPGRFEMRLPLVNAELDYVPGWPAVQRLQGTVAIRGRALSVTAPSAQILSARATQLAADIPDLANPVLTVDAALALDLTDLQRLLSDSPLARHTGGLTDVLALAGPATAQLGLTVPLRSGGVQVSVDGMLQGASARLSRQRLDLSGLQGPVSFHSGRGLNAERLQGELWRGRPVQVSLQGEVRRDQWWRQRVSLSTPTPMSALATWSGLPLTQWFGGEALMAADVDIPVAAPGQVQLRIASDLVGVSSRLPAPLQKAAAQRLPLRYDGTLGGAGGDRAVAEIAGLGRVHLGWQNGRLQALHVGLGQAPLAQSQPGKTLALNWPSLDLNAWHGWWQRPSTQQALATDRAGVAWREIAVQLGQAQAGTHRLEQVRVTARPAEAGWLVRLAQLRLGEQPALGVLSGEAIVQHEASAWSLRPLVLKASGSRFDGEMTWASGRVQQTALAGELKTDSLSALLAQLTMPSFIEAGKSALTLDVSWPGSPEDFALKAVNGRFQAEIGKGRLKESAGINLLTRGFGLLNAGNLMRRLKLDFTDVTRKGLNFDQIKLQGELAAGVANPASFNLQGPTVNISGKGWVDISQRTLAQELRVGVPVSSAVPLVAGFLAGPVVGGALVAADLLLDKQLAKVTSLRYRISGPWQDLKLDDEALELPPGVSVDDLKEARP